MAQLHFNQNMSNGLTVGPLSKAVMEGKAIFLSLEENFGMPSALVMKRRAVIEKNRLNTPLQRALRQSTYPNGRPGHYRHNVHNVHDMLDAIKIIEAVGGKEVFKNVRVAYQGFVLPYERFFVDTEAKQKDLFIGTYVAARMRDQTFAIDIEHGRRAYAIPRLLRFRPSNETRRNPRMALKTVAMDVTQELVREDITHKDWHIPESLCKPPAPKTHYSPDKVIMARHFIDAAEGIQLDPDMMRRDVYVLATCMVYSTEVSEAYARYKFSKRRSGAFFVGSHLCVDSTDQITSAKGHKLARAKDLKQRQLL